MIKHLEPLESGNRCRRWKLVAGSDKAHRRSRIFNGAKRDALKALDGFAAEVAAMRVVDGSTVTLSQYIDEWLESERALGVEPQTVLHHSVGAKQVLFALGDMRVQSITPRHIKAAYADMLAGKAKHGRPLAKRTVERAHHAICVCLDAAIADGIIASNPAREVRPPKPEQQRHAAFSDMELRLLLAMLPTDDGCAVAAILAASCGLRHGELSALRWECVNLENGVLEVLRSSRKDGTEKSAKTGAGNRVVPLPPVAVNALREWRALVPDAEYVVCDRNGDKLTYAQLTEWWEKRRALYGCEGVKLHDLRHAYITSLARAGAHPKVIQELAGHATPIVALQVYTHLSDDDKRAAVDALKL